MSNSPLVSVVTPVYNGYAYLAESIESVLAQSYENWELIILDNHSTDGSGELAASYAAKDSRIKLHSNSETLAQMPNWNRSMSLISEQSQYCKVVHADDWLFPDCLTQMVALAEKNKSVAIVGAYRLEEEAVTLDGLAFNSECIKGVDILKRRFLGGNDLFGSPSSIMYRSDQVRARVPFYNEDNLHADTEVCFDILGEHDFGFVHQVLTFTRRHNETTSTYAKRMNTYKPSDLWMLKTYGAKVLSEEQLNKIVAEKLNQYDEFLGHRLFKFMKGEYRGFWKEFWCYHQDGLEKAGESFSRFRVFKASVKVFYKTLISKL